jgi:hypothetical protein
LATLFLLILLRPPTCHGHVSPFLPWLLTEKTAHLFVPHQFDFRYW